MSVAPAVQGRDALFELGPMALSCGRELPDARLAYRVFGELNADRSNLVLYPSSYGAWPEDIDWVVGPILDPTRFCVLLVSQFGNGRSSSPSTSALGLAEQGWVISHADNVAAQQRLIQEVFEVERLALIYGWSMGAQQAYHWAALAPERVERICCLCGTARTTPHNRLFLLSLRQALTADPAWDGTRFRASPEQGLRTFALIYASWAASQAFYRQGRHEALGYGSVEAYVERSWLPAYRRHDPHDLLAMLDTWLANDLAAAVAEQDSKTSAGIEAEPINLAAALGRITARTTVIAGSHDLYFPPDDCAAEAALIAGARFERLESVLGHRAGNPREAPAEQAVIRAAVENLLRTF
ncbi:alpha/beta fold hydrolase [Synechococcus sp. CS-602]|uniref:alpha/beta fold hydrolase n=1 Tax=Synechococcaceae TaxID=1890426 RepID=UPI0009FA1EEF|nr:MULTISPECIES: alpha/beta fold hydrolase [Synechococcaceae]MCT4364720.1 alpha/beta fold hydrolase [Candidatus Regnicoccus frigidus MAG-AL1]MCT0201211.1 alpha/beta fold hydrolase [Synechococcus sp. CS-603]MCT0205404.1 alpha/beta fold hydrolase [Synechococcus sp. CS-602]MCT0245355.1 alpha/beta fold hydrolase [Synechococcus sp. CS-601]MCT4366556.1 alpha/beta fold hydrolase [Candidatus Regnicoccus frigidus MAG-AL2]